jgi:acetamidase/formamidase
VQRIKKPQSLVYELDHAHKPLLRVKQGESFVVETNDALSGSIREPGMINRLQDIPELKFTPPKGNPCGGPVFVEGAERGDLLEVTIERIVVDEQGFTGSFPGVGPLADSAKWQQARGPWIQMVRHLPGPSGTRHDGKGVLNSKVAWDLAPMIGTLATAPDREVETTTAGQGPFGGNLDIRDIKEGTKVLLNVYHPGGLLYVGDVHGSQGDTEFYGTADETGAEVTLSCKVIKKKTIPFVRLVKPNSIVSVYSFRPLEDAVESAIVNLMDWMVTEYGVSEREAYMHACINPEFRVNVYQMVRAGRLQYTVGAEIPKKYLVPSA